jgi:hypothetical protein
MPNADQQKPGSRPKAQQANDDVATPDLSEKSRDQYEWEDKQHDGDEPYERIYRVQDPKRPDNEHHEGFRGVLMEANITFHPQMNGITAVKRDGASMH